MGDGNGATFYDPPARTYDESGQLGNHLRSSHSAKRVSKSGEDE